MNSDSARRIQQLERMVGQLMGEVERLRNQRQSASGLVQPVIAIIGSTIAGKSEILDGMGAGTGTYDVTYGSATIYDLGPPDGMNVGLLQTTGRTALIANPWDADIEAGTVLGWPHKNHYLVGAEECPV